jgi:hypothetical protein
VHCYRTKLGYFSKPSRFGEASLRPSNKTGSIYLSIQPPTLCDEQRLSGGPPAHLNVKVGMAFEFGFNPRSTNDRLQPRTHAICVSPTGALTTISKSGSEVCALAAIHPRPTKIAAIATRQRVGRIM